MMSLATSRLLFKGYSRFAVFDMIEILFVSTENPAPLSLSEFRTIKSRFFDCSLCWALFASLFVSSANPITVSYTHLTLPTT